MYPALPVQQAPPVPPVQQALPELRGRRVCRVLWVPPALRVKPAPPVLPVPLVLPVQPALPGLPARPPQTRTPCFMPLLCRPWQAAKHLRLAQAR